jgi:hypothetical protein
MLAPECVRVCRGWALHGPLSIGRHGPLGTCCGLGNNIHDAISLRKHMQPPLARHKVEVPATSGDGISVRDTHDLEVIIGGTGAGVLSPTRARGNFGDKTPLIQHQPVWPRARQKRGSRGALACLPISVSQSARAGPAGAVTGQLWERRALVIAARGLLGLGRVPDYDVYDSALFINIRAHL